MLETLLMRQAFTTILRGVRLRFGLNLLMTQAAVVLAAAGAAAAAAVLVQRVLGIPIIRPWTIVSLAGLSTAAVVALTLLRLPSPMRVAVLIDRRLALRERFSTALAFASSEDPFARAAVHEAHQAAEGLDVPRRFPVRPSRHWAVTAAAWLVAAGLAAFLPELDVLGYLAGQRQQDQRAARDAKDRQNVEQAVSKVKAVSKNIRSDELDRNVSDLEKLIQRPVKGKLRHEAIRKLSQIQDKVRQMQSRQARTADELSRMLKSLRDSPVALSNELNRALARGDFAAASKAIQEAVRKLDEGGMTQQDRKALADQLKDVSRQLAEQRDRERQLCENALRQEGVGGESAKQLAGLSEDDLREQLKQRGLTDEQIDRLMDKLDALREACRNCEGLSQSLAECSGSGGQGLADGLAELVELLDAMETDQIERADLADALAEIEGAIALLGGQGGRGGSDEGETLWQAGDSSRVGGLSAGRGAGKASGLRDVGEPEDTDVKKTGVKNKPGKDSEIVASWLINGPQTKGVSKRELADVTRAAKDAAAEAVRDNKVPRKYEGPVKSYFGGFDKTFDQDANSP